MAFSFQASTPAFGAASTPAFNFSAPSAPGIGTSTFGAPSPSPFGATTTTTSTPGFGGAVSTPAFSFSSSPGLFGASTTPATFGATTTATPSLFGGGGGFGTTPPITATTPSLFGGGTGMMMSPSAFPSPLAQQQLQQQQQQQQQLVTKDHRPVTHSTVWDDLAPQAQHYLLELEKLISSYREECRQLDGEERLQQAAGARGDMEAVAKSLSQSVAALGVRVRADAEEAEAVREEVMHLLRHTETTVHTFKRTHAWREMARLAPGQPLPSHLVEQLGGPVALPSSFLVESVASLKERMRGLEAASTELEIALQHHHHHHVGAANGSRSTMAESNTTLSALGSLQSSISNVHDCLMRSAAALQVVDDRLTKAKAAKMAAMQARGDFRDPFAEAEKQERAHQERLRAGVGGRRPSPSPQQQQQKGQQQQQQQQPIIAPLTGLFGTATPPPAVGTTPGTFDFGGGIGAAASSGGRKSGSRRW